MRAARAPGITSRLALLSLALSVGCGPAVDLTKGLQVEVVSSGWLDAGVQDGKNKIVPTVSFTLKNVSDQKLVVLQVNALFKRVNDDAEWGSGYQMVVGSEGLAPGATTPVLKLTSQLGYTGTDARADLLKNSAFADVTVELFAKYGSGQWTRVSLHPVSRELIAR